MNNYKIPKLSIVICCYNSVNRIVPTITEIARLKISDLLIELVLIDNNSSDNTTKLAQEKWRSLGSPFPMFFIEEKRPGLSFARRKGVESANGEIVLFCDDDNWLAEDFVVKGVEIMNSNNEIGVLGGRGIPVFEGEKPEWFSTFQGSYAVGCQGLYSGDITGRGYVWGAGCFVRRDTMLALYSAGFTSLCTDRKGNELSSGGDSELCKWHILIGKKLWYDDGLIFKHYIENHRLQKEYHIRLIEGFNSAMESLSLYDEVLYYEQSRFTTRVKIQIRDIFKYLRNVNNIRIRHKKIKKIKLALRSYNLKKDSILN